VLLAVSMWIRLQLERVAGLPEDEGRGQDSKAPLTEAFGRPTQDRAPRAVRRHRRPGGGLVHRPVLRAVLPDADAEGRRRDGQHPDRHRAAIGTPFFIVFGWLSDKIGRKPIILAGCLLAALTYFPLFKALTKYANPALAAAQERAPVTVVADPADCSFQFDPVGTAKFDTSCDIAKSFLAKARRLLRNVAAPAGTVASVKIGDTVIASFDVTARGNGGRRRRPSDALTRT
jgi:hypothetical protein